MGRVREHVLRAQQMGRAIHQTAGFFETALGVSADEALQDLEVLVSEGVLAHRLWVHCPKCGSGVLSSREAPPRSTSCDVCEHHFDTEGQVTTAFVLTAVRPPSTWTEVRDILPGPDLDLMVARALGMVPCEGWEPINLGSAGGPGLMGHFCYHQHGACWPTAKNQGVGGVPPFSTKRVHLSLADLPPDTQLRYDGYAWHARLPGIPEIPAKTEPHLLSLALLISGHPPRWNDENRWRAGWREFAVDRGLDPTEWSPHVFHLLRHFHQQWARHAADERRIEIEDEVDRQTGRMVIRAFDRNHTRTMSQLTERLTKAGVPEKLLTRLMNEAIEAGTAEGDRMGERYRESQLNAAAR